MGFVRFIFIKKYFRIQKNLKKMRCYLFILRWSNLFYGVGGKQASDSLDDKWSHSPHRKTCKVGASPKGGNFRERGEGGGNSHHRTKRVSTNTSNFLWVFGTYQRFQPAHSTTVGAAVCTVKYNVLNFHARRELWILCR